MKRNLIKGIFCISLDFEKYWGVHDIINYKSVKENFMKVDEVVEKLLSLFKQYDIHATWASVGLLGIDNKELLSNIRIPYINQSFSPYPLNSEKLKNIPKEIVFGQTQLKAILQSEGQDLGSHTFSHYYTLETGQKEIHFLKDLQLMSDLGKKLSHRFKTIVFPRNQVNPAYLPLCANEGYVAFRGNQINKYWTNSTYKEETFSKKLLRSLDAYFPTSRTMSLSLNNLPMVSGLVNIPASRFFRPIGKSKFLERRKLKRIKDEMKKVAQEGKIYHLWWHPHNFTSDIKGHLHQLTEILNYRLELDKKYEFVSMNMKEIAEYAKKQSNYNRH